MKCPTDGTTLQMSERSGIEIDYCPECRGVWLDRGELDKIIAKSIEAEAPAAAPAPPPQAAPPQQAPMPPQAPMQQGGPWGAPGYPPQQHGYDPRYGHKGYKRKKSFLEEIFD
jgi:Zn-finger nucleic acid-binding protein